MKKTLLITSIAILSVAKSLTAQNLTVPDVNFKAYLVGNLSINTNADTEIQLSEASSFNGYIFCGGLGIADLNGIGAFTGLTALDCSSNLLTSLNLSNNINLTWLSCPINSITGTFDVSANTQLTFLECYQNSISVLDVSNNMLLTHLACGINPLGIMDVSNNSALTFFNCNNAQLYSLTVQNGNNVNLTQFNVTGNPFLTCVQVDDATYMTTNWASAIDATAAYDIDCGLGLSNSIEETDISIYPNPTSGSLTINTSTPTTISIYNVIGEELMLFEVNSAKTIDISAFNSGIYFAKTKEGKTIKFVKE